MEGPVDEDEIARVVDMARVPVFGQVGVAHRDVQLDGFTGRADTHAVATRAVRRSALNTLGLPEVVVRCMSRG